MKVGAENRTKVIVAAALAVLAAILVGRFLFGDSPSTASSASPVAPVVGVGKRQVARRGNKNTKTVVPPSLDPTLRLDLLKESEDTKYSGTARNIFTATAEPMPVPKGNGTTDKKTAEVYTPPSPPPPPPILLKFFGFASKPGEPKKIFLSQGEDVFVAAEGDIIDRRYRILHIGTGSVEVEDVLNNNRQSIPLTQG